MKNREFEFRAFDSISKKMWNWDKIKDIALVEFLNKEHYAVMQYTGMLDKNGTKIFEGDIFKSWNNSNPPYIWTHEVCWSFKCLSASDGIKLISSTMLHVRGKNVEVIGNVHQN